MNRLALLLLVLAACPAKLPPAAEPTLPGEGNEHTAKPPEVAPKKGGDDPWANAKLLPTQKPVPQPAVVVPAIDTFKLANGLTVLAVENHRLPIVSMQLAVRAGRAQEPRARLGVSEMAADTIVKGTTKRDAAALARAVDAASGTLGVEATFEATLLTCVTMQRASGMCLDVLPDLVENPTFPIKEVDAVRDKLMAGIRSRGEDAATMASLHVQNLLWGNDHVRGWINDEQSISSLRRDDLVTWHKTWFVPGNATLVVTGDVDKKKLKAELERAFGGWKKAPVPPSPTYPEPGLSGSRIRIVDRPGATQTQIRIAQFGIAHDDKRFYDTLVWNGVLGGGSASRLGKAVREASKEGRSYAASSSFDRNIDKGTFMVSGFARTTEALAITKVMLGEIAKMHADGPSEAEANAAVANLAGGYAMRFQTMQDLGSAVLSASLHGYGRDYLAAYPVEVGKVTAASARAAASAILDPKAYVLVLVGDAKDLEPQLQREGWHYEKVSISAPVTQPLPQQPQQVDPKAIEATKKVIADALAVKGGKAKLAAIKTIRWEATGTTAVGPQSVPVKIERTFVVPDKIRIDAELTLPNPQHTKVPVIVSVDGTKGWQLGPNQQTGKSDLVDIAPQDVAPIEFERWREPELILVKAADPKSVVKPEPDEDINGRPHFVFELESPFNGLGVSVYIDKGTKLVTRISYTDGKITNVDEFANYKAVSGIQIAHHRVQSAGGRVTTLDLTKYELDAPVPADKFAKPAAPPP